MTNLEFFKNEAKKFLKDWRTQTQTVESDGIILGMRMSEKVFKRVITNGQRLWVTIKRVPSKLSASFVTLSSIFISK